MLKRSLSDRAFEMWAQGWSRLSRQWRDRSVDLLGWFVEPYPGQPFVHSIHVDARVLSKGDAPCQFRLTAGGGAGRRDDFLWHRRR